MGSGLNKLLPNSLSMFQGVRERPVCINLTMIQFNETVNSNVTKPVIVAIYPEPRFSVRGVFPFRGCNHASIGCFVYAATLFAVLQEGTIEK